MKLLDSQPSTLQDDRRMVMEAITARNITPTMPRIEALPEERDAWPENATKEYRQLLRELNDWSREHDWPTSNNSWIAEEAVRRSW